MMSSGRVFEVLRLGVNSPVPVEVAELRAGEVGFVMAASRKSPRRASATRLPPTIGPSSDPLSGFKPMKPMVFSGLYPTDSGQYQALREALEKLRLNDSSFTFEPETSQALGFGFRCGFLVCCIWTSSVSGWSGSFRSASSRPRRRLFIAS
jgi:GTP-binding protein LepA